MSGEMVQPLAKVQDQSLVGGKAAPLSKMIKVGFNVPPGFVIIAGAKASAKLEAKVLKAFDELGVMFVAVRSSAIGEDSKDAAWAGQFETFLNVPRREVWQRVQDCWASVGSERAKSYAKQKSIKIGPVAVLVQAMIPSETSGIGFSVNPITKNADQIIIEAGYGLNEPIVAGQVTPDTYLIDSESGQIQEKHISKQTKKLVQKKSGGSDWQKVDRPNEQKISDRQVEEIRQIILRLAEFFDFPIDMEWTYSSGKLYVLQSRPITTLE